MSSTEEIALTRKDFVTENDVRWCPGCGDYAILNSLQRTFPELGIPREKFVVISGIGCSSRFPYYMNTYGFHTIHGRAPTVATGVKVANPELSVWMITGDGDGLSIGGNHLLHLMRRNVNVNVLLFNNRIYGLTKGQYSPTSQEGTKTKSTPLGSLDRPINPLRFALSAEASFVARTVDNNPKHMVETFKAAAAHPGLSFVEIMQNCVIFNDKTWEPVYGKDSRKEQMLLLEEGQPLRFGADNEKGILIDRSLKPKIVEVGDGEGQVPESELLVHTPRDPELLYPSMLAQMTYPDYPTPIGVIRATERPTYEQQVHDQIAAAVSRRGDTPLADVLRGENYWKV
jgi:2-oxoglutarate ferredoxin oxidoreductase subunit beta